ncbi:hypothetical protein BJV82DRAFT_676895 [Fennellomyces sp. T-0311]|nr:hypothetical protein BJV82DRAFT_676895 [Fennellomyces sp. T-0311]
MARHRTFQTRCPYCKWDVRGTRQEVQAHLNGCIQEKLDAILARIDRQPTNRTSAESSRTTFAAPSPELEALALHSDTSGYDDQDMENDDQFQYCDYHDCMDWTLSGPVELQEVTNPIPDQDEQPVAMATDGSTAEVTRESPTMAELFDSFGEYNIPDTPITEEESIAASIDLYALAVQHGVPRECFDAFISRVNKYTKGKVLPLRSHYRSRKALRESFPITTKPYQVCPKGCKLFTDDDETTECIHCHAARFEEGSDKPASTMQYLPLKDQLALLTLGRAKRIQG